jgi:hypothetical protein
MATEIRLPQESKKKNKERIKKKTTSEHNRI